MLGFAVLLVYGCAGLSPAEKPLPPGVTQIPGMEDTYCNDIVLYDGKVWFEHHGFIEKIDLDLRWNRIIKLNHPDFYSYTEISAGENAIWAITQMREGGILLSKPLILQKIDPATARITASATLEARELFGMAVGEGSIWVLSRSVLYRLDTKTLAVVATISNLELTGQPRSEQRMAVGEGAVWIGGGTKLYRINPSNNHVDAIPVPDNPSLWNSSRRSYSLITGGGAVWVATPSPKKGVLFRGLDPTSDAAVIFKVDPVNYRVSRMGTPVLAPTLYLQGIHKGYLWAISYNGLNNQFITYAIDPNDMSIRNKIDLGRQKIVMDKDTLWLCGDKLSRISTSAFGVQ